jgi:predicted NBD/HSP70 family sugar kinase
MVTIHRSRREIMSGSTAFARAKGAVRFTSTGKGKSGQSLQNVRRRLTRNWLDRAAEALSIALVGIENLFDPEAVILGASAPIEILNGLFGRLGDLRPSIRLGRPGERIRVSSLREQSAAVGAAALPIFAATNPSRFY